MPTPPGSPLSAAVPDDEAWGAVAPRSLRDPLAAGRHFVFGDAETPDGEWLIGTDQPDGYPGDTSRPSYAVLYGVATGEVRRMAELGSHASQILWAGADDRWVVWSEAADQPLFYDWVVRAYDRRTRQVRDVARRLVHRRHRPRAEPARTPDSVGDRRTVVAALGRQHPAVPS